MKPSLYMFKIGIKNSCDICCDLNGTPVLQKGRSIEKKKKKISLLCSNFVQQFLHMLLHVILLNSHEHPGHTVTLKLLFMFPCVWWRNGRYKAYLYSPSFQERTQVTNRY